MNDNDKLIKLSEVLEMKHTGSEFSIEFPLIDCDYGFEPGDTERLLESAAEMVNMEVVLKGKELAKLRIRVPPMSMRRTGFDDDW